MALREAVLRDVKASIRSSARRPLSTGIVVVVLAAGIAACLTAYGAGRALITDVVPFPRPEELFEVALVGSDVTRTSNPSYEQFRAWDAEGVGPFSLGAYRLDNVFLGDGLGTTTVMGSRVSGQFFSTLGTEPLLGRSLSASDTDPASVPVVLLSQDFWKTHFAGSPDIVGEMVRVNGTPHSVVGVARAGMEFPAGVDLWTALRPDETEAVTPVRVIARLDRAGAVPDVESILSAVHESSGAATSTSADEASRPRVVPFSARPADSAVTAVRFLQAAMLFLLLITATNAAAIIHARTEERRSETWVRMSLGASKARVVRALMVETTMLSLAAGVIGLGMGEIATSALRDALPREQSRFILGWDQLGMDLQSAALAVGLALVIGVGCAAWPAVRMAGRQPTHHLTVSRLAAAEGRRGRRAFQILLCAEIALTLTLLLSAGLQTRSFLALNDTDVGFDAENILTVEWTLPPSYSDSESVLRFQQALLDEVGRDPEVRSLGIVSNLPMSRSFASRGYHVEGVDPTTEELFAAWRPSTAAYFETFGVALRTGRGISDADGAAAARVAVVSDAFVRRHWPERSDVLGNQVTVEDVAWTIVGVVEDVLEAGPAEPARPTIYVPQAQAPTDRGFLVLEVPAAFAGVPERVRTGVRRIDADVALGEIRPMTDIVDDHYAGNRVFASIMIGLATVAVLITLASLFALVSQSVARRRREMGVRIALGATDTQILASTASPLLFPVLAGITLGMVLALGAAQVLATILYGIEPFDPLVFTVLPAALLGIAAIAGLIPALDATRVDPVEAIRS